MKHKLLTKGFTLIELLFVVAIMAVIATIAVTSYQKRTETAKVDKAALQVQQIMQAAIAYQTDNGCWPNTANPTEDCNTPNPPPFAPYLPVGSKVAPWDNQAYAYNPVNNNRLFQVRVKITDSNLGERVKALLPNATYNAGGQNMLVAEIAPTAGGAAGPESELLMDMGKITLGNGGSVTESANGGPNNLPVFSCPAGYKKAVYASINTITANPTTRPIVGNPVISVAHVEGSPPGSAPRVAVTTTSNTPVGGGPIGDNGTLTALYIEVCVPENQTH